MSSKVCVYSRDSRGKNFFATFKEGLEKLKTIDNGTMFVPGELFDLDGTSIYLETYKGYGISVGEKGDNVNIFKLHAALGKIIEVI